MAARSLKPGSSLDRLRRPAVSLLVIAATGASVVLALTVTFGFIGS